MLPELDFRNLAFRRDPHEEYAKAREKGALAKAKGLDAYVVVSHAECESLLKDPRISLDHFSGAGFSADHPMQRYFQMRDGLMLFANSPRHEDLRNPARSAMSSRLIRRYEESIRELAQEAIRKMKQKLVTSESVDFVREISVPFVSAVICKVVGMPAQDHSLLAGMTQKVADGLDPFGASHDLAQAGEGYVEFQDYMREQLALGCWTQEANEFADSFLGDLAQCPHMLGDFKSSADLISTTVMLLSAGHLTTNHSLSLSVRSLLTDSSQQNVLKDGTITPHLVEELFRYHTPAQITRRRVTQEVEVAGNVLQPGQALWLSLVSANRDENVFSNPQELDFSRKKNPHLAFGGGQHFCLGVHLARLQLRVFLEELAGQFPKLRVEDSVDDHNLVFRGLKSLRLSLT